MYRHLAQNLGSTQVQVAPVILAPSLPFWTHRVEHTTAQSIIGNIHGKTSRVRALAHNPRMPNKVSVEK